MLTNLSIRDVVLIGRLDLSFHDGLGVLTGETGAGKSILLDALGLALGARAEQRLVRHGAEQASVTAAFEPAPDDPVWAMLAEHGIRDTEGGLVLRRVLGRDGRSKAFINDQPASVQLLRETGQHLVEIHGQFENQRLLNESQHRHLLDAYGGLQGAHAETGAAYAAWRAATDARVEAEAALETARRDEEYLRHAVDELTALDPRPGEEAELAERRRLLQHAEQVTDAMNAAAADLGDDGALGRLRSALRHLEHVSEKAAGGLGPATEALARALSEAEETEALLAQAAEAMDLDPAALEKDEERLFRLRALARKHAVEVDGLAALATDLSIQLQTLEDGGARLRELAEAENRARQAYITVAEALSQARRKRAAGLDKAVGAELKPLRLGKARFITAVETMGEDAWGPDGQDRVAFQVVTNPGSPAGPLNKISSGGELARFTLALKAVLAEADPVPTLIFDEVDSGVGGAVAAAVGERLQVLAQGCQVLVVTHSPQVAAKGRHHWLVSKSDVDPGVLTTVDALTPEGRKEEIARMLAGARVTDEARAAAVSLLGDSGP